MNTLTQDKLPEEQMMWSPMILDRSRPEDAERMDYLISSKQVWRISDTIEQQLRDLSKTRAHKDDPPERNLVATVRELTNGVALHDYGRWVYYPWSGRLVHILPPDEFQELRLDRNQYKITKQEQERLSGCSVGIVGMSVGNAVALTLALEASCGYLKLADFDRLELSNMNRIRAGIHDVGLHKTVLAARQIYEMNPYAGLILFHDGLSSDNLDQFLLGEPKLDILIDECDDLRMKFLLRERARVLRLPVLMETSDRGMIDVERFDLEHDRPLFHGLVGGVTSVDIPPSLSDEDKVKFVLPIIGLETMSTRLGASMFEIEQTISTWPQLGADVSLGGASATIAVRRLALGQPLPSGRHYIDIEAALTGEQSQHKAQEHRPTSAGFVPTPRSAVDERIPEFIRFVVEHATLAPSAGNSQPWRFYFDGDQLWLVHDRQRSKNLMDMTHRAAHVALGAAIENIVIAAAQRGFRTHIEYFPRPEAPAVVASLRFEEHVSDCEAGNAELFARIGQRATDRKNPVRVPLDAQQMAMLRDAVVTRGGLLYFLTKDVELEEIGDILGKGNRLRFLCPELHGELMSELRWTPEEARHTGDGIDIASLELSKARIAGLSVMARPDVASFLREIDGGQVFEENAQEAIAAASAVGLITIAGESLSDMLRGGRAMQHLWLTATSLGLALHPMTPCHMYGMLQTEAVSIFTANELTVMQELETRFNRLFPKCRSELPVLLFRILPASAPTARSLRRPVAQVLFYGAPIDEG